MKDMDLLEAIVLALFVAAVTFVAAYFGGSHHG